MIWQWRRELDSLGRHSDQELRRNRGHSTPEYGIRRTDEVTITTEVAHNLDPPHRFPRFRPDQSPSKRPAVYGRIPANGYGKKRPNGCTYRDASTHANKATIKYCKCAMLFFLALLCTWVPSSVNRIYTLIHPQETPFGPEYAAGLVLPLQGFWNFVVYVTTSLFACKCLWRDIVQAVFPKKFPPIRAESQVPIRRSQIPGRSQYNEHFDFHSDTISLKREPDQNGTTSNTTTSDE